MAVLSYREVLPRTLSHKFGESPTAERKFVATLDGATATQDIINGIGIFHGSAHPEFSYLLCLNVAVSETDLYHAEVTYSYAVTNTEYDENPLLRPDVWSFSTGGVAVPCVAFYDDANKMQPLVNTAGDLIESAMTEESEVRATVSGNRASFPLAIAAFVTNTINAEPYLGCPAFSWKCNGISGQQAVEVVNGVEVRYYQIAAELAYRASGWRLILPNVGWNVWSESQQKKIRAYVFDESDEKIPAVNQVALNENGSIRLSSDLQGSGRPDIMLRRVHRAVPFGTYFGNPTF